MNFKLLAPESLTTNNKQVKKIFIKALIHIVSFSLKMDNPVPNTDLERVHSTKTLTGFPPMFLCSLNATNLSASCVTHTVKTITQLLENNPRLTLVTIDRVSEDIVLVICETNKIKQSEGTLSLIDNDLPPPKSITSQMDLPRNLTVLNAP